MLRLTKYLKPFWIGIILIVLLLVGQAIAELFLPTLMSDIVNDGIIYGVTYNVSRTDYILRMGIIMLGVASLAGMASIIAGYISPKIAMAMSRELRKDLFTKVESFSQAEFDTFSSSSLITRCTNDINQVQTLVSISARMLLYAPILGIGGITMAVIRAPRMSWTIILSLSVLIMLVALVIYSVISKFTLAQKMLDKLNKVARETLHGLMVIRAFGTQQHEKARFDDANIQLRDIGLYIGRIMSVVMPLITFVLGGSQVLVIWVGSHHVANAGLPIGDMMAFMQYATQVVIAFLMISMVSAMIPRAQVSAKRILEVLDVELSVLNPKKPLEFSQKQGPVTFENVYFRYPGAETNAIEDISFTAYSGQTLAIIGATGSGKSTIAQLLLRFYDVTQGKIMVEGLDVRQVRQEDLRYKIGYIPQKGQLLSGTIASNISYGTGRKLHHKSSKDSISDDSLSLDNMDNVKTAATIAQAMDFINEKEGAFDFEIAQGGSNVSGGQRQRLSIARALANSPEILVFDDSFSALDFQTDAKLRAALKEHTSDATVIIIAQRVGTILNAEQIIVLDEGKIVGKGTHNELLKSCPAYYEIASSQGALENKETGDI